MATSGDKYRSYLSEEEIKNTKWNFGPPNYDDVDKLFEEGRTNIWPVGSLEEKVERLVKTWEMELMHKADPDEYKTLDAKNFKLGVNEDTTSVLAEAPDTTVKVLEFFAVDPSKGLNDFQFHYGVFFAYMRLREQEIRNLMWISECVAQNQKSRVHDSEIVKIGGGYNAFLQTSLPTSLRFYNSEEETADSSQKLFKTTFPRGFVLEILQVYSGPPVIVYKFRHWGFMEGPFKGHAPTGEMVEFIGMAILELDEHSKIVKKEVFSDRGELLAGLIKGKTSNESTEETPSGCPIMSS
ncbi:pathogenesis-related family protein [Forsythia ovata]|uniref:Pathogenesis-related family protein n=1 Tax=Forsythia ovata TaxID=205694 RepID=A0ABD1PVB4_9LAMI